MDENLPEYAIIINKLSNEFDDEIYIANKNKELEKENDHFSQIIKSLESSKQNNLFYVN